MATTSVQHSKRDRNFGSKGGGALDNGSRLRVKGGREAPGNKKEGINNHGAKGSRGPWKRPAFDGKGGGKVKRPWKPNQDQKVFQGSAREGKRVPTWALSLWGYRAHALCLVCKPVQARSRAVAYSNLSGDQSTD